MATVSHKYQILRSRFDVLVDAVKFHVEKVARKLFEKNLISNDNKSAAENDVISQETRASKLLDHVLVKVKENDTNCDVFIAILEEIPVLENQADKLRKAISMPPISTFHCGQLEVDGTVTAKNESFRPLKIQEDCERNNVDRFPYLDMNRLSKTQKKHLTDRLSEDTENIISKFGSLVCSVFASLYKLKIPAEQLGTGIVTLWSKPNPLPKDHTSTLCYADSIFKIQRFLFEHKYISFINYKLLESIIANYGSQEDKTKMKEYLSEFSIFCKRSVFEVPSDVIKEQSPESEAKFAVKVSNQYFSKNSAHGENNTQFTMQDLIDVQRDIEKIINCPIVYINDVKKGCVEVTFMIISDVAVLSLSETQLKLFSVAGLTVLKVRLVNSR